MTLQRRTPLQRTKWEYTRKPMKKRGETKRKKEKRYGEYMRSPAWKKIRLEAIARAGRQCEYAVQVTTPYGQHEVRCPNWHRLTVHHLTYARFGGNEQPEDLQVLCVTHHREIEKTKHSHRHTHQRRAS